MADRVLPSRDEVVGELDGDTEAGEAIIEAYASGLLVDCETIERRIRSAMTQEVDEWADVIVNAALFEGEAHREAG